MISKQTQDAVARYYAAVHGTSEEILKAFADARVEFIDDDLEWVEPFGTFQGADAVAEGLLKAHAAMAEELSFVAEEVFPSRDNTVCVFGHSRARLRVGAQFEGRFVHIWEFTGDRANRMVAYNEDGVVQRALGLDENASAQDVMGAMGGAMG